MASIKRMEIKIVMEVTGRDDPPTPYKPMRFDVDYEFFDGTHINVTPAFLDEVTTEAHKFARACALMGHEEKNKNGDD